MKRNHSLLEYTRDNDTQVSKLGPFGPSCLLMELSPFVLFEMYSCPLCNSSTLQNILMVLGRNVEQEETMCHLLLALSPFVIY